MLYKTFQKFLLFLCLIGASCQKNTPNETPSSLEAKGSEDYLKGRSVNTFDDFLDDIVDNKHRYYQPYYPLKMKVFENHEPEFKTFEARHHFKSPYKPLIGYVTPDPEDVQIVNQLFLEIDRRVQEPLQRNLMTYEVLTKVLAYRQMKVGQTVSVPTLTPDNKPDITIYKVDKVFDLCDGMPAFGLTPESPDEAPPLLLFRGTDLSGNRGSTASILADLDLSGPGLSIFESNKDVIREWLYVNSLNFMKTQVMGYSLGGSFTEYVCIFFPDLISHDPRFPNVAFNQPGVAEDLLAQWKAFFQSLRPLFISYITEGDMVSTVGQLFGDVHELSIDKPLEPLAAHLTLMSVQSRLYSYKLDVSKKLDNSLSSKTHEKNDKSLK